MTSVATTNPMAVDETEATKMAKKTKNEKKAKKAKKTKTENQEKQNTESTAHFDNPLHAEGNDNNVGDSDDDGDQESRATRAARDPTASSYEGAWLWTPVHGRGTRSRLGVRNTDANPAAQLHSAERREEPSPLSHQRRK